MFYLNLFAAVRTTRLVIPEMRKRGGGRVINITSIYGREAGGAMTYNAVKASMNSWSSPCPDNWQSQYSGQRGGARVDHVSRRRLGAAAEREPAIYRELYAQRDAPGPFWPPEEVAAMVVFLASERATLMIGACINVDGCQSRSNI